ncbi:hypothetical protein JHK82_011785 [Glycine max]|nr:hypothetical protein JHK86_011780 [Glycine max]KAG5153816.1 hypothetical protein JHK82_011785 [Glycine max]
MLDSAPSFLDSLKTLETDIQHANVLTGHLCDLGTGSFYSKGQGQGLPSNEVHSNGKSDIYSSGRKATIREFYNVILPSLQRLHGDLVEADTTQENDHSIEMISNRSEEDKRKSSDLDLEREHECGICLESCTKMVFPNCCHAMCINCYSDG